MSRYFVQRRTSAPRSFDWDSPVGNAWHIPTAPEHEATDTGLIDANGDAIMRGPNPMGFVWPTTQQQGE